MTENKDVEKKPDKEGGLAEYICDELCRHPVEVADQETLDEICRECPLGGKLVSIL